MTEEVEIEIQGVLTRKSRSYPNYSVSKDGRVFRISSGKEMTQTLSGVPPYYYVRTCHEGVAKNAKVHRIVAEEWCNNPNPETKTCVNHLDGNKLNNHMSNLEWVTHSENSKHAVENGLIKKGQDLYNTALSEYQVHEVCKHLVDGWRVKDIADKFETSKDIVRKIKAGDTWFHIRSLYEIPHTYISDFSESTIRWVCTKIIEGFSDSSIAKISSNKHLKVIDVKRIRHKIRYRFVSCEYF